MIVTHRVRTSLRRSDRRATVIKQLRGKKSPVRGKEMYVFNYALRDRFPLPFCILVIASTDNKM